MAGAASYVPIYWALQRKYEPGYDFGDSAVDYVLLTLAGLGFAAGLVEAIVPSEAERRARAYREMREKLPGRAGLRAFQVALAPGRNGAALAARIAF
jgi:hypothetical protein